MNKASGSLELKRNVNIEATNHNEKGKTQSDKPRNVDISAMCVLGVDTRDVLVFIVTIVSGVIMSMHVIVTSALHDGDAFMTLIHSTTDKMIN